MNISDKKDIISKVLSQGNSDVITAEELEALLDKELSKPDDKIDFELVNELSLCIIEAKGNKPIENDIDKKLMELENMKTSKAKRFRMPKWSVGLVAACLTLVFANAISVSAWNMNIFTFIVEFSKGGVTIDFGQQQYEEIVLPTSEQDPYGIIAKCEEYDISAEAPHYLPDGFVLTHVEANSSELISTIDFVFENKNQRITLHCTQYYGDVPKIGLASDEHNITEVTINGTQAVVSKEDNQMNFAYNRDKYVLNIFTQDVDYSECEKIIQSIS